MEGQGCRMSTAAVKFADNSDSDRGHSICRPRVTRPSEPRASSLHRRGSLTAGPHVGIQTAPPPPTQCHWKGG